MVVRKPLIILLVGICLLSLVGSGRVVVNSVNDLRSSARGILAVERNKLVDITPTPERTQMSCTPPSDTVLAEYQGKVLKEAGPGGDSQMTVQILPRDSGQIEPAYGSYCPAALTTPDPIER